MKDRFGYWSRCSKGTGRLGLVMLLSVGVLACAGVDREEPLPGQELDPVSLLEPRTDGGRPLMAVLKDRKSGRSFSDRELPAQVLSDLLWAAFGINRPESGKRTAASAMNWQEVDVYVATRKAVYLYEAKEHRLRPVVRGDHRGKTGMAIQRFVKNAPVNLVFIADFSRVSMAGKVVDKDEREMYSAFSAGSISQNVYLFCASEGLSTVARGLVNRDALRELLNLKPHQKIILAQSVGYPEPP